MKKLRPAWLVNQVRAWAHETDHREAAAEILEILQGPAEKPNDAPGDPGCSIERPWLRLT